MFAVWLVVTAAAAAVTVALYAEDLSKPQADFTLAVFALGATGLALAMAFSAWTSRKKLRKIDKASKAAAGPVVGPGSGASSRYGPGDFPARGATAHKSSMAPHLPARTMPIRCMECGAEIGKAAQFCAQCGAPIARQRPVAADPTAGESSTR
jgi:hypothetical protein